MNMKAEAWFGVEIVRFLDIINQGNRLPSFPQNVS